MITSFILIFISLSTIFLNTPNVLADDSDNFNSGFSSWNSSQSQRENAICGSACSSVKLSNTTTGGDGWIRKNFTVIPGAEYRISINAGVFTGGSGTGEVWLMTTSGGNNQSSYCNQSGCTASGSSINGSLTISNFVAGADWLTVQLAGVQGDCVDGLGCRDPYADDFSLVKTADPSTVPTDGANCTTLSINNGDPINTGQTYPVTILMRNDGGTTWNGSTGYNLGAQDPQDDANWGTSTGADSGKGTRPIRQLSNITSPGDTATFNFSVTAPDTAGTYRFAYQMVKDGSGGGWFGGKCQPNIIVTDPGTARNPSVTCSVRTNPVTNPPTTSTGQTVTWTAAARGGTGTGYTFSWAGSTDNLDSMTTNPVTLAYATIGIKSGKVTVTDSAGNTSPVTNCSNTVTISEPFDYRISNSGNITLAQGSSGSTSINLEKLAGNAQPVSLSSSSEIPSGASKGLSPEPNSCSPNSSCDSSFTISTGATTPIGTYPITVNATSPGVSAKATNFNLVVTAGGVSGSGSAPTVNIKANNLDGPVTIAHNSAASLSWTTTNSPTSCIASGTWCPTANCAKSPPTGPASPQSTGTLTGPNSYIYTLTCANASGSNVDSVRVEVTGPTGSTPPGSTPPDPPVTDPTNQPWIQTTGGDVHSNTRIDVP